MAGPMSWAAPMPSTGPFLEEGARLVGLVEGAGDQDGVVRRVEGLGQPPRGPERGRGSQARPDRGELEQLDRALVHRAVAGQRRAAGPETDG